ncbi:hypothetical protein CXB51_000381 [Gossypium anomalum]|uniref:Uncharacterized protein n=1 Tax=Gossypium anomalum TaxID=47600 RepID=A0A8J5ZJL4_9ROSI|nr:hypothetical protein CXB51_000381 [Gossypium anomalum]
MALPSSPYVVQSATPVMASNLGDGVFENCSQIWPALKNLYGNKTTPRLMFYTQHKGDLPMKEFLIKIKGYCDNLASCGEVISEHEHVTVILNGLSPEYESIITVITASQIPYSVQGVTTMLLDVEER